MLGKYYLTVIGAGPTGLFAAYSGGFRGLRIKLMDSMPAQGETSEDWRL